jgi:acyl-CoA synthetase (AMP-forming)/AMP-acid ligase II
MSDIVFRNVGGILQHRAKVTPENIAYTFLPDGEQTEQSMTYAQLDLRARAVAASLQNCARAGERALLMFPSGLDYIVALFGCFYAVPAQTRSQ